MSTLPPEQTIIRRLAGLEEDALAAAYLRACVNVLGDVDLEAVVRILERRGRGRLPLYPVLRVQTLAGQFELDLTEIVARVMQAAGELALPVFVDTLGLPALDIEAFRREATFEARQLAGGAVRKITAKTRQAIRELVAEGFEAGLTPAKVARELAGSVGLDPVRARTFAAFRRAFPDAPNKPDLARIAAEHRRLVKERSKVIARTELASTAGRTQLMVWNRAVAEGKLNADAYTRVWIRIPGGRPCRICDSLKGKRARIVRGYFLARGKRYGQAPAHPRCLCGERLEAAVDGDRELPQLRAI